MLPAISMKVYDDGTLPFTFGSRMKTSRSNHGFLMPYLPDAKSGFCIGSLVGFFSELLLREGFSLA